jgi:DNA repair exonuclease SbcCD nuclease subunit
MDIKGLTIVSQSALFCYKGLNLLCLPWQRDPQAIIRDAEGLRGKGWAHGEKCVVIGHFTVSGAMTGSEKAFELYGDGTIPIETIMGPDIDFAFLGHIHKHQMLFNKVMYIGSMDRVDFGERFEEKGSVQFDWTPESGVHNIKRIIGTPQAYTQLEEINGKWTTDWSRERIAGAVIKVKIKCTAEERKKFDFQKLYRGLATAKYVLPPIFETPEDTKRNVEEGMSVDLTFEQALKLWLEKQEDIKPDTRIKILKAGKELLADPL